MFNFLKKSKSDKNKAQSEYYEKDNLGTRMDTMSRAVSYWLSRIQMKNKPPFTLYIFQSAENAERALLNLPYIHKAKDSGKLICDRVLTFGYYAVTENGKLTGEYEACIIGNEFTLEEFKQAEAEFERNGGRRKSHDEPDASVKTDKSVGNASKVKFSEKVKGKDGISTYEVYTGPDKASAIEFLKGKPVSKKFYFVVVDTPEGSFGRDIDGFYQE